MAGRTFSEKVLGFHATNDPDARASAGEIVVCTPDLVLGTDGSTPMAIDYFEAMGGAEVRFPDRVLLARDHYAPPRSAARKGFHAAMESFAADQSVELLPVGGGISFQVAIETGRVKPGDLVVGADSHTVTCGAVGAFATGIGSADLAGVLLCGQLWLRVPETIRVVLEGRLHPGVGAKDVALTLVRQLGSDGGAYAALEFQGPVADELPVDDRMVLSNMSAEVGAKAGIFPTAPRSETSDATWAWGPGTSDPFSDRDARFAREVVVDVSGLEPTVAMPHDPSDGVPISECLETPIDFVFLGTCAGGRAHDFRAALAALDAGGGIAEGVTVVVTPSSRQVREVLESDGTLARLEAHGALVTETGCGPCCGTSDPLPPVNARVISTANRNFKARMGQPTASIWLASPVTCAAAATAGRIIDPREVE